MPLIKNEGQNDNCISASFWKDQKCLISGNYKFWCCNNTEYLIDIKNDEEIIDFEKRKNLKNKLDKIYKQFILKQDYYTDMIDRIKSLGYLQ